MSSEAPQPKALARIPDDINILLADSVISHKDGKISVIGLFQVILVQQFPAAHRALTVVVEMSCGVGTQHWTLDVVNPEKEKIHSMRGEVLLRKYADKHNIIALIPDLPLEGEGEWHLEFGIDGQVLKTRKFFVQKAPAPLPPGRGPEWKRLDDPGLR